MEASELIKVGEYLYGSRWKSPLARTIGVSRETISRMANNKQKISSQVAASVRLLADVAPKKIKYKERHFAASGKTKTYMLPSGVHAKLVHGDSRKHIYTYLSEADAIVTDPVWPNAIDKIDGSHDPHALLYDVLRQVDEFKNIKQIVIQLRCDSDTRILSAVPPRFPFLRTVWLPYAIPSRQGRMLISGDVGYVFGILPKLRPGLRVLPGQPHSDYCPPARPSKGTTNHPCSRSLEHVEWLIEKFTNPGETVLDPFMGSGTTGLAAVRRGRNFIGIDIDRNYVRETRHRLEAMVEI